MREYMVFNNGSPSLTTLDLQEAELCLHLGGSIANTVI